MTAITIWNSQIILCSNSDLWNNPLLKLRSRKPWVIIPCSNGDLQICRSNSCDTNLTLCQLGDFWLVSGILLFLRVNNPLIEYAASVQSEVYMGGGTFDVSCLRLGGFFEFEDSMVLIAANAMNLAPMLWTWNSSNGCSLNSLSIFVSLAHLTSLTRRCLVLLFLIISMLSQIALVGFAWTLGRINIYDPCHDQRNVS